MTLLRRRFAHLVAAFALSDFAGCTTTPGASARDVQTVDLGLDAVVKVILLVPALSKGTRATLTDARAAMDAATKRIVAGSKSSNSDRQAFVKAVNAIIAAAAQVPGLPLTVSIGLGAASVLLPLIERAFGLLPLSTAIDSSPLSLATAESVMTPDQARDVLGKLATQQ